MGSRSPKPNQGFILSNRYTLRLCKFGKKIPSTGPSNNIILRMNQHMILKIGSKSPKPNQYNPLPVIVKCFIFASLVTIHPFLQKIWCKSLFNILCPPVTLKIGSRSPEFIQFFSVFKLYTYLCLALINQSLQEI